jgi:hypothetical protein
MKKFFITLLVLIIGAALVLFFGWAQLGVPPDSYGLIRSKTHGLDARLVKPGEFRWVWYKLIPTNVTTTVFRLNPLAHAFSANNTLPSGGTYAAFAGIGGDFSWEIRATFSFSLRPEAIIPLVTMENIGTQEELDHYETAIAGQIETFILRRVDLLENLLKDGESPELERAIQEQFPAIGHFSLTIQSARLPDFALYRQTKDLYEQYNVLQKEFLYDDLRGKAKSRVESFRRFDELEQYGALLTKYPILLEYLALENGLPK